MTNHRKRAALAVTGVATFAIAGSLAAAVPAIVSAASQPTYVFAAVPKPRVALDSYQQSAGKPSLSLTIQPYKLVGAQGQHNLTKRITLTNSGSRPVSVGSGFLLLTKAPGAGAGCTLGKPPAWATVSPAKFTLLPGQARVTTVSIRAPHTATGTWALAAAYGAKVPGQAAHSTGLALSGRVAAPVTVSLGGKTTSKPCTNAAPKALHQAAPATPWWPAVVTLVALAALLTWLSRWIIRRRRRRHAG